MMMASGFCLCMHLFGRLSVARGSTRLPLLIRLVLVLVAIVVVRRSRTVVFQPV